MYGAAPEMASPLLADESAPLVVREERKGSAWSRAVRYGGAMAVGALLVGAGVVTTSPSHPVSVSVRGGLAGLGASNAAKLGQVGPVKYGTKHGSKVAHQGKSHKHAKAPAPVPHAERVRMATAVYTRQRLGDGEGDDEQDVGGDDITDDPLAQLNDLNDQIAKLMDDNKALTTENVELEKQVQNLEQSIIDTRTEFLKIGHGGKNKHLAGSHENDIIADLENQLKDKHYELEKTRQAKYKLYLKNTECFDRTAGLDKDLATCAQDKAELSVRAEEVSELEECKVSMDSLAIKMAGVQDELEIAKTDLAAARGDDHDDNARIASLESKLTACNSDKGALSDELGSKKVEIKTAKLDKAKTDALVEELNAKAAASDDLADRLKGEIEILIEDVKACELDGRSFNFFCSGEGETCECPDGDVVFGPRYHASDDSWENTFADVVALQTFTVTPGTSGFACDVESTGKDDVSPGSPKGCFCVPKNLVTTPGKDAALPMPALEPEKPAGDAPELFDIPAAPDSVACDSEKSCQAAAEAAGLDIGGGGYEFAGEYGTKGCYTYNSGKYEGQTFFGTGGDADAVAAPVDEPKVRVSCPAPTTADDVITDPVVLPIDQESYEDSLEEAPADPTPEVHAVDVNELLEDNFEDTVGEDTIDEIEETDAVPGPEEPEKSEEPEPEPEPEEPTVDLHGTEWTKYEEEDAQEQYEDAEEDMPAEPPSAEEELFEDTAAKIEAENAAKAKAEADAKAAAEQAFAECQAMCAADNECCNNDITQGSNQRLSCLQSCTMVRGGVTEDACDAECAKPTCEDRVVNGVTYQSCSFPGCDDVPAHKDSFGDKFKPAPLRVRRAVGHRRQLVQDGLQERRQGLCRVEAVQARPRKEGGCRQGRRRQGRRRKG